MKKFIIAIATCLVLVFAGWAISEFYTTGVRVSEYVYPTTSGGATLGSADLEWGHTYIADDKKIYLGSNQDFSMEYDEDGNDTASFSGADIDYNGQYAVQLQNVPDLASRGASFWFDADAAKVTIADDAKIDDVFDGGGYLSAWINPSSDGENNLGQIVQKGETVAGFGLFLQDQSGDDIVLRFAVQFSGTNGSWATTSRDIPINTWTHVVVVYDSSATTNDAVLYLNGDPATLTTTVPTGVYDTDNGDDLVIGSLANGTRTFDGQMTNVEYGNLALSAAEVKALSSGAEVPYKYVGASQTEMMLLGSAWTGATGATPPTGWTVSVGGIWTIFDSGDGAPFDACLKAEVNAVIDDNPRIYRETTVEIGKRYRVSFWFKHGTATEGRVNIGSTAAGNDYFAITGLTDASWTQYNYELTATTTSISVLLLSLSGTSGQYELFDEVTVTQIGCVLNLNPEGIGHNQWQDSSSNQLVGDVSGPIPTNLTVDAQETYLDLTMTGDTSFTLPMGYQVKSIIFVSDGAIGGGLDVGTTDGGGELVAAETIGGAVTVLATLIDAVTIGATFTTADDTLYVTDADGTGWDGASVELRVQMQRLTTN